jgi:hypothetical protein
MCRPNVTVIAMSVLGDQFRMTFSFKDHAVVNDDSLGDVLKDLFHALSAGQVAMEGDGLFIRVIDDPNIQWQPGPPSDDDKWKVWVVKTSNPDLPEAVVVPNGLGTGFMHLADYRRRKDQGLVQDITHHRPLLQNERKFLMIC